MSAEPVNNRRTYDNSGRAEQAAATQRRIVDAALRMLVARGYGATTMTTVAAEARVSRETIYKAFVSKPELVKRVYDVTLVGDEDPAPLRERPEYRAMVDDGTGAGTLRRYAAIVRGIYERLGPLLSVLLLAARSGEPDLQWFGEQTDRESLRGARHVAELVAATGELAAGLTVDRAADVVWVLRSPEVHHLFTAVRGWSGADYERWLADSLVDALLGPGHASRPPPAG